MNATELVYLTQPEIFQLNTHVKAFNIEENGEYTLVTDKTIFYPQGGGQPCDQGYICYKDTILNVEHVVQDNGSVIHKGNTKPYVSLPINATVTLYIDQERRLINSIYHSAGHLIDNALEVCDTKLEPGKGFHHPHGSYVEYHGNLDQASREALSHKLQQAIDKLIDDDLLITSTFAELNTTTHVPIRLVTIGSYAPIPCGGTHIASTGLLKSLYITKIKNKKDKLRISYKLT